MAQGKFPAENVSKLIVSGVYFSSETDFGVPVYIGAHILL
jgi:hypothetical protein